MFDDTATSAGYHQVSVQKISYFHVLIVIFFHSSLILKMGKNKRPKNFYVQLAKKQKKYHSVLSPGLTGFLCTCNDRERDCVIEAYNILNEYADQMYGKEEIPGNRIYIHCSALF